MTTPFTIGSVSVREFLASMTAASREEGDAPDEEPAVRPAA
ncbi:MAG TPA: hypothetical protein VIY70_08835 [Acidimicrobiia bacterium]